MQVRATNLSEDSTPARISKMAADAQVLDPEPSDLARQTLAVCAVAAERHPAIRFWSHAACTEPTIDIQIVALQASKPQLRRWIDTVGEVYSKVVIAATIAALIILPMRGVPLLSTAGQRCANHRVDLLCLTSHLSQNSNSSRHACPAHQP